MLRHRCLIYWTARPRHLLGLAMKHTAIIGAISVLLAGQAIAEHVVDDSYTVARRFEMYRGEYPGISWPSVSPQTGQTIAFDLLYKSVGDRDLHMDVFSPAPRVQRGQGILLVHGGAWRSGSKAHFYAMANLLAQRGYTVFLPEYRLAPEARYPAGMEDIGDALAWAQHNAPRYGLIAEHVAIGGASSGGQMASLLGYAGSPAAKAPNALIDLDGVLDTTNALALQFEDAAGADSPLAKWLGGSFSQAPAAWRQASPALHVGRTSPPTLIVSSGTPRFTAGRESVLSRLQDNGIRTATFTYRKAPHDFWLFEPFLSTAVERIDTFLRAVRADERRRPK